MALINIKGLTFSYPGQYDNVFEKVSFQIDSAWKLGFIGRNGKGKTTFLKLLMNYYEYSGQIFSEIKFNYFPFEIENKDQWTINIIEQLCGDFQLWKLLREFHLLNIEEELLYRSFNTLSGGEQTKVMLAVLFINDNYFLLIDEPTNHLDYASRHLVADYLKRKKGFILVSHDRIFLDQCIDHVLSINKNNITIEKGNFSSWYTNKTNQDNSELEKNWQLKKDIKRLEETANIKKDWSNKIEKTKYNTRVGGLRPDRGYIGHKSAKMMQKAKNLEKRMHNAIDEKTKLLKNIEEIENLKLQTLKFHTKTYLRTEKLEILYNESLFVPLSFEVNQNDRVLLRGNNGCGKTSILKLIYGFDINYRGIIEINKQLIISYISQNTDHLFGSLKDYIISNNLDESLFKAILRKLDFTREQFDKKIDQYSQGQKKKLLIATSLAIPSHILIWDEPLNYIDVISRIQIENLIMTYQPTMIFVEHDEMFCDKIATKIIDVYAPADKKL